MGRIVEALRIPTADAILGHYAGAEASHGSPIPISDGVGRTQFQAKRDEYHGMQEQLISLSETQLPMLIEERTAVWGNGPDDQDGIWSQLKLYKPMIRLRLGTKHPLNKTVPNLGEVYPSALGSICFRFEDHWTRVNAALTALTKPPLTLGAFTLAQLQAGHATIEAKTTAIKALQEGTRPLLRAEMEQLYGDVPEEERDEDSLVALMQGYTVVIQTMFAGQPIAQSLPSIFPASGPATLPTFRFNWSAPTANTVKTWLETPDLPDTTTLFLKEGAVEQSQSFNPNTPGSIQSQTWTGLVVIDALDQLELQNPNGTTLARGERDASLTEPPTA